jgi:hypothetical protein
MISWAEIEILGEASRDMRDITDDKEEKEKRAGWDDGRKKKIENEDEATQRNATIGAAIITKRRKREERGI